MTLLILFFLLSICFSFLCSIWEAVLLSINPAYISRQGQEGTAIGAQLEEYKEDIDRPLSAILTLNTIAHTCLLYTSPSPRDLSTSRMPSSA